MTEREFATEVVAALQRAGHQALWAGGCVRDELLGVFVVLVGVRDDGGMLKCVNHSFEIDGIQRLEEGQGRIVFLQARSSEQRAIAEILD